MPSVVDSLSSLVSSLFHAITATIGSIVAVFQSLLGAILGVFQTFFAAVGTAISGLAQTFEGLVKFLLGNIVVIGGAIAAFVAYSWYQQRSGRTVSQAPAPVTAKKVN
ncbi:hypothetical protein B7494_g2337 [Chlorociboria aeruginascens]|nr:hypothetical protein B7494_g2337 [Chlorociboria aeruginascens]